MSGSEAPLSSARVYSANFLLMPVQDTLEQTLFVVLLILDKVLLVIGLFVPLEGFVEAKFHQGSSGCEGTLWLASAAASCSSPSLRSKMTVLLKRVPGHVAGVSLTYKSPSGCTLLDSTLEEQASPQKNFLPIFFPQQDLFKCSFP